MSKIDLPLDCLYDTLFQAWPLMRQKLLPTSMQQAEFGMPLSHVEVLAMLYHEGSLSVSQISREFGIAKPNITTLVDRMIEEGLVERERSDVDRRVVNVVIRDQGRERLESIYGHLGENLRGWVRSLSTEDLQDFYSALNTIVRVLGAEK